MNSITSLLSAPETTALGAVLLHFLWQGSIVAAGLAAVLRAGRQWSSGVRHQVACTALALLLVAPFLTFAWLSWATSESDVGRTLGLPIALAAIPETSGGKTTISPAAPTWLAGLACAWGAGVILLGIRLVGGWCQTLRLVSRDAESLPPEWQLRLQEQRTQMHVRQSVRLLESLRVHSPLVVGWLRPVILLPVGMVTGLPLAQVDAILMHELAHIRGQDYLINVLQRLAETLLFYHPAVWWVSEQIRREREHRCDDLVAAAMGESLSLAGALLTLAEREAPSPGLALAADGTSLAGRIRRLLGTAPTAAISSGRPWRWALLGLLVLGLMGLTLWFIPLLTAPKLYQSTARVRIEKPTPPNGPESYDPYFLANQFELVRSSAILRPVVANWMNGRLGRFGSPRRPESMLQFRDRVRVRQYKNTSIVEITVAHEDREAAASLANAIAERLIENRVQQYELQRHTREQRTEQLDYLLKKASDGLAHFAAENAEPLTQGDPAVQLQQGLLNDEISVLRELKTQDRRESLSRELGTADVLQGLEIIDQAEPGLRPIRWRP